MVRKILFFVIYIFLTVELHAQDLKAWHNFPEKLTPGKTYTIETVVKKGSINGFMKYAQEFPEGISAVEQDSKNGSFSFVDNTVKIIWMTPPSGEEYTFSYKITIPPSFSGKISFKGKILYINNNERFAFELNQKEFIIGEKTETKKDEPMTKVENKQNTNTIPETKNVPATAIPNVSGITYKVQIGAFSQKPNIENVPEISTFVLENGITKYFSGNFSTYEQALERKKQMIEKGYQGAFIVKFENGKIVK